jgi:hypothetical protein
MTAEFIHGDCREELPKLPAAGFDVVFTDPPYPCVDRSYGRWTEAEWFAVMHAVVPEVRRVLKPSGSAVFVLQPNSERVGRMRTWLWEFLAWVGREWGVVQDAYWWNTSALPVGGACKGGLMRGSVRQLVWAGPADCYRSQGDVLWSESEQSARLRAAGRFERGRYPSRTRSETEGVRDSGRRLCMAPAARGGVTPFNLFPHGSDARWSGGTHGHPASTPLPLCAWWLRYLCPPDGAVLDPFAGSGTVGVAALRYGASFTGIEVVPGYVDIARKRLEAERARTPLFAGLP